MFSAKSKFVWDIPVSQSIIVTLRSSKPPRSVDLRQTRIPHPFELGSRKGLASYVEGWECRKVPHGHVLLLWYACPQDLREHAPEALCSSTGEWERFVATSGHLLDRGFSTEDSRYEKLQAELGYDVDPNHAEADEPFISIHWIYLSQLNGTRPFPLSVRPAQSCAIDPGDAVTPDLSETEPG